MARGKKTGGRKKGSRNKRSTCAQLEGWSDSKGIPYLMSVLDDKSVPASLKIDVAKYLIDREKGKPRQAVEHSGSDNGPIILRWAGDRE